MKGPRKRKASQPASDFRLFRSAYHNGREVLLVARHLYNKAACPSVCTSATSPRPQFWADFKTIYIYGVPMVQGRFKNYFQGNRSRNKKRRSKMSVRRMSVRPVSVQRVSDI